jgi:Uncharacterized protein conserved in bacteria (DUF2188)
MTKRNQEHDLITAVREAAAHRRGEIQLSSRTFFKSNTLIPTHVKNGVLDMSNNYYIEKRKQGDFAIRKQNSLRASAVEPTQAKAIQTAKEMNPKAALHVERVRYTQNGSPDKWRKI